METNAFPWTTFDGPRDEVRALVDEALRRLGDGWRVEWPTDLPADPEALATRWLDYPPAVFFPSADFNVEEAKARFGQALRDAGSGPA